MLRQHISDDCDRFADPFCEFMLAETMVHRSDNALPEFVAAFFVNRFIANDSEFMGARRYKNEHGILLPCLVHTEPMKLPLRHSEGIALQFPALDQNANLTGRFRFGVANRLDDPIVLKLAEEFSRSHLLPTRPRAAAAETAATTAKPAESSATAATGRPASPTRDEHRAASSR